MSKKSDRSPKPGQSQQQELETKLLRAMYCVRHQLFDEAIELISAILTVDPNHKHARRLKSRIELEFQQRHLRSAIVENVAPQKSGSTSAVATEGSPPDGSDKGDGDLTTEQSAEAQEQARIAGEKEQAAIREMHDKARALVEAGSFYDALEVIGTVLFEHPDNAETLALQKTLTAEIKVLKKEEEERLRVQERKVRRTNEALEQKHAEADKAATVRKAMIEKARKLIIDDSFDLADDLLDTILRDYPTDVDALALKSRVAEILGRKVAVEPAAPANEHAAVAPEPEEQEDTEQLRIQKEQEAAAVAERLRLEEEEQIRIQQEQEAAAEAERLRLEEEERDRVQKEQEEAAAAAEAERLRLEEEERVRVQKEQEDAAAAAEVERLRLEEEDRARLQKEQEEAAAAAEVERLRLEEEDRARLQKEQEEAAAAAEAERLRIEEEERARLQKEQEEAAAAAEVERLRLEEEDRARLQKEQDEAAVAAEAERLRLEEQDRIRLQKEQETAAEAERLRLEEEERIRTQREQEESVAEAERREREKIAARNERERERARLEEEKKQVALAESHKKIEKLLEAGALDEAQEMFNQVLDEHPLDLKTLAMKITVNAEVERRRQQKAESEAREQQRIEKAAAEEKAVHEKQLREIEQKNSKMLLSLEEQASTLLRNGKFTEAHAFVEIILAQDRTHAGALALRGKIHEAQKQAKADEEERRKREREDQLAREKERARAAEEKAGKLVAAMVQHAQSLLAEGSIDQAATLLESILIEHPDNKQAAKLKRKIAEHKSRPAPQVAPTPAEPTLDDSEPPPIHPVRIPADSAGEKPRRKQSSRERINEPDAKPVAAGGADADPFLELSNESAPKPQQARKNPVVPIFIVLAFIIAGFFLYRAFVKKTPASPSSGAVAVPSTGSPEVANDILKSSASAFARHQYDSALALARSAVEADPGSADAARQETKLLVLMGKYDDAITLNSAGLERNPQDTSAMLAMGTMLPIKNKLADALKYFDQALPLVRDSLSYLTGAMTEIAASDPALASQYGPRITSALHTALAKRPADFKLQYKLLQITEALGDSRASKTMELEHIQSLMSATGSDPLIPVYLALTMTHHAYYDEAIQLLGSLEGGKRTRAEVLYKVAEVYSLQSAALPNAAKAASMRALALKTLSQAVRAEYLPLELISRDFAPLRSQKEFSDIISAPAKR